MITSLYTALLSFILFYISLAVIKGRRKNQISLGSGENNEIEHLTSAHKNFISYAPIFLIQLYLLEMQQVHYILLHLLGLLFCLGRVFHFIAFKDKMNFRFRVRGMKLTLWPMLIGSVLCLFYYFKTVFNLSY